MGDFFITPTGSGNKSGSNWANAAAITSMDGAIRKAGSGGTVYLAGDLGSYKVTNGINIFSGATFAEDVTIKGVNSKTGAAMEATIEGTRPATYAIGNASGNELFKLQKGAGNLHFENLQVNNTATVFRAAGDVADISIEHVDAVNVAHFFQTYIGSGNKTASVTGLTLRDIDVQGFSKGLIDVAYDSSKILIEDVRGDSERQDGDEFAIGVHLRDTVHDVVLRRVTMENATDTTGGNYWNGDGFATEARVHHILFEDTVARGNTDSGYDLKSSATTLLRTVSEDNSRNYRIWGETAMIDVVGLNPDKRGGALNGQNQVHVMKGAALTIDGGYFADAGSGTRVFLNEGGSVSMTDVEIVRAATGVLKTGTIGGLEAATITLVDAIGKNSAGMVFEADAPAVTMPVVTAPIVTVPVVTVPVVTTAAATTPTVIVPGETTSVVTAPVTATPVMTSPVVTAPQAPVSPIKDAVVVEVPLVLKFLSTATSDAFVGTAQREQFHFDQSVNRGSDSLAGFGADDVIVTRKALADGNGDGIITFGRNGLLDIGGATLKLPEVAKGLRLLGESEDGFVYGDAAARPVTAAEGKIKVADTLSGDAKDKVANTFFFDTALGLDLGKDKVVNFGAKDLLVTTVKLGGGGATVESHDGVFTFHDGLDLGSVAIAGTSGAAIATLEFDGEQIAGGVHYYVYSMVGSTASHTLVAG